MSSNVLAVWENAGPRWIITYTDFTDFLQMSKCPPPPKGELEFKFTRAWSANGLTLWQGVFHKEHFKCDNCPTVFVKTDREPTHHLNDDGILLERRYK